MEKPAYWANTPHLITGLHSRGSLPHLKRQGATYFVTFREAGTLPKEVVIRFKSERDAIVQQAVAGKRPLTWHEREALFRWYSDRVDRYLDAGHGASHLGDPQLAELVNNAVRFFEGSRYHLRSWVVMPNHVHVVVSPMPSFALSDILHSWKSFTSHEINKRLEVKMVPYWQSESYEHLIRDDQELSHCCQYTEANPVSAGLCTRPEEWPWSSASLNARGAGRPATGVWLFRS